MENTTEKMKRQDIEPEMIFAIYVSKKVLLFRIQIIIDVLYNFQDFHCKSI